MKAKKRVLIAGAAGFVGSHLCERFIAEGYEVLGVDNFLTGRMANLRGLEGEPDFDFIEHDISTPLAIYGHFDWVFHFASPASPPKYQRYPIQCLRVNAEGTRHLLELCEREGASFFLASTSEVYGDPLVHPQGEEYWGRVNPVGPRSMYDEAKRYAEALTRHFSLQRGVPVRIVRIFNTYGPRMAPDDGRVISNFICQALSGRSMTVYGDGRQTRSFQYIDDLVEGILKMMAVDYEMPINLGNPEEHTILETAQIISELLGLRAQVVHMALPGDDPRKRRPDIGLAGELLGWTPEISIREGLRRSVEYFRQELQLPRAESFPAARP